MKKVDETVICDLSSSLFSSPLLFFTSTIFYKYSSSIHFSFCYLFIYLFSFNIFCLARAASCLKSGLSVYASWAGVPFLFALLCFALVFWIALGDCLLFRRRFNEEGEEVNK